MNRHGSLIWWLVCMGLVLCWVWNFQSAANTSDKEMAALVIETDEQAEPQPLESIDSELRFPKMDQSVQQADEIAKRISETPVVVTPPKTSTAEAFQQASTFDNPPEASESLPFIDLADLPETPVATASRQSPIETAPTPARTSMGVPQKNTTWPSKNELGKGRITNPYFDEAPTRKLAEPSTPPQDPVLTMDDPLSAGKDFSEASELPGLANETATPTPQSTNYNTFDDLKQEQSDWTQKKSVQVSPADQFVGGSDITPVIPAGQKLTSNPTTIQQCVNHIEYGKSLARRGAAFAAREEFYSALRMIAQSNDAQTRSTAYTQALREAITALNEADDFFTEISHEGMDVNVGQVVEAHASRIIPADRAQGMSSMIAIQAYFEFARRRLNDAFGENVVASEALFSLGKLFTVAAAHDLTGNPLDYSKSIVMHYASIDCDSNNFKSSNELGVLMARNGRLEKARDLFRESLLVQKMPQTWKNLAVVHERIAQASNDAHLSAENLDLAQKAQREYEIARQSSPGMSPKVQWVTPEQFEQTAPPEFNDVRTAQAPASVAPAQPAKPNILNRWKDLF